MSQNYKKDRRRNLKILSTPQFYKILNADSPILPLRTSEIRDLSAPERAKIENLLIKAREEVRSNYIERVELSNTLAKTTKLVDEGRTRFLLEYDRGIAIKAKSACEVMEKRNRPCNIWGWAGQFAFDGHLEEHRIKRTHDDPHYFPDPDNCDFRIDFDRKENRIEVKTTMVGEIYRECRVYKTKIRSDGSEIEVWHRPDYVIAVKCLNEDMTMFKIYGWITWKDVEEHGNLQTWEEGSRWGIPLESPVIKDYSILRDKMLKK